MNEVILQESHHQRQVLMSLRTLHREGLQHLRLAQCTQAARCFSNGLGAMRRDLHGMTTTTTMTATTTSQQQEQASPLTEEHRQGEEAAAHVLSTGEEDWAPYCFAQEPLVGLQDPAFHPLADDDDDDDDDNATTAMRFGSAHEHPYIFNHPLLLRENVFLNRPNELLTADEIESLSCVFVFNLALTYHLQAMMIATNTRTSTECKRRLKAAMSLYSMALTLLTNGMDHVAVNASPPVQAAAVAVAVATSTTTVMSSSNSSCCCTEDYHAPVIVAVCNNMGHIHNMLGKTVDAKQCFQKVLSAMAYFCVVRQLEDDDVNRIHASDDRLLSRSEGLIVNVLPLILQPRIYANAA